jgi:hypothetical protein
VAESWPPEKRTRAWDEGALFMPFFTLCQAHEAASAGDIAKVAKVAYIVDSVKIYQHPEIAAFPSSPAK